MRILVEDLVAELNRLIKDCKSIRNRVLLERARDSLNEYKTLTERKVI